MSWAQCVVSSRWWIWALVWIPGHTAWTSTRSSRPRLRWTQQKCQQLTCHTFPLILILNQNLQLVQTCSNKFRSSLRLPRWEVRTVGRCLKIWYIIHYYSILYITSNVRFDFPDVWSWLQEFKCARLCNKGMPWEAPFLHTTQPSPSAQF